MQKGSFIRILVSGASGVAATKIFDLQGGLNFAVFMAVFMIVSLGFYFIQGSNQDEPKQDKAIPDKASQDGIDSE